MITMPEEPTDDMLEAMGKVVFANCGEAWHGKEGFAEQTVMQVQRAAYLAMRKVVVESEQR